MTDELRRIQVAAADKETLKFKLDSAALDLEEAITAAVDDGLGIDLIADAAELPVEDVLDVVEHTQHPVPGN